MKLLNKVKISLLIVFLVGLLSTTKAFAVTGVITEITVNLRKEPSTNSKKIMYVTQDDVVEVLEKDGEWYKIKFKGKTGYVFAEYLKVDDSKLEGKEEANNKEQEEQEEQKVTDNKENNDIQDVTTDGILKLKITSKTQVKLIPNISSNAIYTAKKDISVEVIEQLGNWTYIFVDNVYGWVRTDKVVEENATTTNKEDDTKKEEISNQEIKTAYIKYDNVNVRKKASTSSNILVKLKLNDEVIVLEKVDSKWSKIKFNGKVGYISTELLADEKQKVVEKEQTNTNKEDTTKKEESTKQETKIAYIKYDTVNVRKKASTSASILAKLKLNDEVTVLEKIDSTWSKVKFDGQVGYISTELLADEKQKVVEKEETNTTSRDGETISRDENAANKKEEKDETESNKVDTSKKEDNTKKKDENKETSSKKVTGTDIVAYAKKYLGYDYVYGGASPKTGFDCSGLTQYVYKHFGFTLSRSSTAQAKNGKEVSKKDLQPGDLLIFKNQSLTRIGHVGIYIGNNKMIHASEPGIGVVITDLDAKGYNYNKRYVTARRII